MKENNPIIAPEDLLRIAARETQCLMDMRRESKESGALPDIPEEQDEFIRLYQNGLTLIGKAWNLTNEAAAALEHLRHTSPAEDADDTWAAADEEPLDILWGLFNTAVQLENQADRQAILDLAQEIMAFHGLDVRANRN